MTRGVIAAPNALKPARAEVERGLVLARRFLAAAQRANGELPIQFHPYRGDGGISPGEDSPSVFATMYACLALRVDVSPESRQIIDRARPYLWSQQVPPGLWKYFSPGRLHPRNMPADMDTTSGMLSLARAMVWAAPSSRWMVEMQHRRDGRFYTWFAPGVLRTRNPRYWWYVLRDPTVGRLLHFFRRYPAHPRDIAVVVNVHVVGYLGDCVATQGAIRWIVETVERGEEEVHDHWYHDRSACYLALGRAYADGVTRFGELLPLVESRIAERTEPTGAIGGSAINTSICASSLLHFGARSALVDHAIAHLCATQGGDGAWPTGPHYWAGRNKTGWFGSRVYTTALAVEALALYLRTFDA